jgi:hypothetical protein
MALDPYARECDCCHRDAAAVKIFTLSSGVKVPAFTIYAGEVEPEEQVYVQFVGSVFQEVQSQYIDIDQHQVAELVTLRFQMTAKTPDFGSMLVTLDHTRPGAFARVRAIQPGNKFPVIHTTRLHVIATVNSMPGLLLQNAGPPLEFISDELNVWPPEDAVYRLKTKVPFERRGNPGQTLISLNAGAAIVGKNI